MECGSSNPPSWQLLARSFVEDDGPDGDEADEEDEMDERTDEEHEADLVQVPDLAAAEAAEEDLGKHVDV